MNRLKMNLEIRQAGQDDVQSILNCLAAAFAPYSALYTRDAFADTVLDVRRLQERMHKMHILVAVFDGEIIGTVSAAMCEGGEGHLRGMGVLPQYGGTGVAVQLLNAIETWLRGRGCTRATLDTTFPLQAAMKFYEKHGYLRSSRVCDFFGMPLVEYVKQLG
jgi:GNAT superfamily N-acetyltransferase